MKRIFLFAAALVVTIATVPTAQMRVVPVDEAQGHVALGLALRHLANAGIYMMATAHPDDENNGLLVMLNRGQGFRTALATATRGNGGQNEIGPELFEALGVLRTEELAALHRFDGAEQYFTRAVDFGFTIDIDETMQKWGRDEIIGDYVRLIRTVRPDIISAQSPVAMGPGQHAHHAVAAILSHEAYKLAGDATKYPEQIKDGLRPWQPKKFYYAAGGFGGGPANPQPGPRTTRVDLASYDALLGKTYSEIGTEARSMHKCQGQAQLLALPAPSNAAFQMVESAIAGAMDRDERTFFDGIDTTITGLSRFVNGRPPKELTDGLAAISLNIQTAQRTFDTAGDAATLQPLLAGLRAVRLLRGQLRNMAGVDDSARYEIDFRLRQKEREFQQATLVADGIRVEALADDGVVVPGQAVKTAVIIANRGRADVTVKQVKFDGFEGDAVCTLVPVTAAAGPGGGRGGRGGAPAPAPMPISTLKTDQVGRCDPTLTIPSNSRISEPYWHREGEAGRYTFDGDAPFGLPFRPTAFYVQVTMSFAGAGSTEDVIGGMPVQYRYEGNIFSGEKRMDLLVTPAFSVTVSPNIMIIPADLVRTAPAAASPASSAAARPGTTRPPARVATSTPTAPPAATVPAASREVRVTVVNDMPGPSESTVKLELPGGWIATPADQAIKFTRPDESQTVRFQIRPAPNTAIGQVAIKASVMYGSTRFDRGYEVIEYPHIHRQHIYEDATAVVKVLDVKTAPNLTVGYIMGSGDQVPPVLEQLGAKVEQLGPDGLAWGELSRFDTIVIGIRAYERREDLRANNSRLLEYVQNGGTLIEQYNRANVTDAYGPYPAQISNNRITDEHAPVQVLEPTHPVFTTPNKITAATWDGWVQERGLNFLGDKDSRYRDLVQLTDPFPNNPGDKRGALVEGTYGKGRWIYIALGLWRQLPAGTDGAYPLIANLISLGAKSLPATPSKVTTPRQPTAPRPVTPRPATPQ